MFAMRCEQCGEVRWSFVVRARPDDVVCPACGSAMIAERRHPGRQPTPARDERRDVAVLGQSVRPR